MKKDNQFEIALNAISESLMEQIIDEVFDAAGFELSDILPSDWAEKNRVMTSEVSNLKGPFSFRNSPYTLRLINYLSAKHPCRVIVVLKAGQIGFSTSFIENGVGYFISEDPANILFLVGHESLVESAMIKVDNMLDTTGLRDLIGSNANRAKNNKSGDKDRSKEFPGGRLKLAPTNHDALRQESYKYGFIDDFESMPASSKKDGATVPLIFQRFSSYKDTMKLCFISTPRLKKTSNTYPEYLKGDQQKYHVPCPCCSELIVLEWEVECKVEGIEKAGITWELDEFGRLINDSIGYICQLCGGFFDESAKDEMLVPVQLGGKADWIATEPNPIDPDYVSVHINALYAPYYMFGWLRYVKQYLGCFDENGEIIEEDMQTFTNLVLGWPYEPKGKKNSAKLIQKNIRQYEIGSIPEKLSIKDGNGRIIMITIGADMNGKEDDARIDWEIVAWSENQSPYSIDQGSIGTFIPGEGQMNIKPDRKKWTYRTGLENSVWNELEEIVNRSFANDNTGEMMIVHGGCLDTGYLTTEYAYPYIEKSGFPWFGVKGYNPKDGLMEEMDKKMFWVSQERKDLWILNVNKYKDNVATAMNLSWSEHFGSSQPGGFMNFPVPKEGKYLYSSFFEHFEGEEKIVDKGKFTWKKIVGKQNHFWDCRVYNLAAKDICVSEVLKGLKVTNGTWADFLKIANM